MRTHGHLPIVANGPAQQLAALMSGSIVSIIAGANMRFAKCKTFEEAFALSRQEQASIYIAIEGKDGCEYQFHPNGDCFRITEFCPVCCKKGAFPNRIQQEDSKCPSCGRDYTPHLESRTSAQTKDLAHATTGTYSTLDNRAA